MRSLLILLVFAIASFIDRQPQPVPTVGPGIPPARTSQLQPLLLEPLEFDPLQFAGMLDEHEDDFEVELQNP